MKDLKFVQIQLAFLFLSFVFSANLFITHWFKNEKSFLPLTYSTRLILNLIYSTNILNFSYTSHLHPFPFFSKKNLKLIFPFKISHSTSTIHQAPITRYTHTITYTLTITLECKRSSRIRRILLFRPKTNSSPYPRFQAESANSDRNNNNKKKKKFKNSPSTL